MYINPLKQSVYCDESRFESSQLGQMFTLCLHLVLTMPRTIRLPSKEETFGKPKNTSVYYKMKDFVTIENAAFLH